MEVSEDIIGEPRLPDLRRLAAASVAFLTSPSAAKEDATVTEIVDSFGEFCGEHQQQFAHLLTQAKTFQYYFALQEARQQVEQDQRRCTSTTIPAANNDNTATYSPTKRTKLSEITTRDAVAAAMEMFELRAAEDASVRKDPRTTAADACAAGLKEAADDIEGSISPCPGTNIQTGEEEDPVALVSDTEVEMWKWEALSADSEAPTDTEGRGFTGKLTKTVTGTAEISKEQRFEGGSTAAKQDRVTEGGTELSRKETAGGQRVDETLGTGTVIRSTADSDTNTTNTESVLHMTQVKVDNLSSAESSMGAMKTVSVDGKHDSPAIGLPCEPKLAERTNHAEWETQRSSEAAKTAQTEAAAQRKALFSLSAGGIRRRRGRRIEGNLKDSKSMLGKDNREIDVEKEEDVTGQLLGLAQEMKVEATRYGEVLQRDNERLQRTGEAQQQYMDDTEASARQTKSFIKGTGFGFLYTMILLIIGCALFVFMLSFIFFVRG